MRKRRKMLNPPFSWCSFLRMGCRLSCSVFACRSCPPVLVQKRRPWVRVPIKSRSIAARGTQRSTSRSPFLVFRKGWIFPRLVFWRMWRVRQTTFLIYLNSNTTEFHASLPLPLTAAADAFFFPTALYFSGLGDLGKGAFRRTRLPDLRPGGLPFRGLVSLGARSWQGAPVGQRAARAKNPCCPTGDRPACPPCPVSAHRQPTKGDSLEQSRSRLCVLRPLP